MAQIRKIRIVNFTYDDGKKMIADELFDLTKKDSEDVCTTLFRMRNGGGKSVMVQLLMQPIIPKAVTSKRKIESFFTKPADHCYVVIEWRKDNSSELLLTGISMSASDVVENNDDEKSVKNIKYYTFITNYNNGEKNKYSIENIPLSRNESGRFVAESFSYIRDIARKSNGKIEYYSSDDSNKWREKLSEYGIIPDEWHNIMQPLNEVEGGITKYFEEYKKSDQLIDKLLIPVIERKNEQYSEKKDDSSLKTIFVNHLNQAITYKDKIDENEINKIFCNNLEEIKDDAVKVAQYLDDYNLTLKETKSFNNSLITDKKITNETIIECENKLLQNEKDIFQIEYEKNSAQFYLAENTFNIASGELESINKNLEENEQNLKEVENQLNIIQCAKIYKTINEKQNKLNALEMKIASIEKNEDTNDKLRNLKYSVYYQLSDEMPTLKDEIDTLNSQIKSVEIDIKNCEKDKNETNRLLANEKSQHDKLAGIIENMSKETDNKILDLNISISRKLDGLYSEKEFTDCKNKFQKELTQLNKDKCKIQDEQNKLELQKAEIPEKIAQFQIELHQNTNALNELQVQKDKYIQVEKEIESLCTTYSIDYEQRFTNMLCEYVYTQKEQTQVEINHNSMMINLLNEQINATQRGKVHITKAVLDYLQSQNIDYKSCEQYLLNLVDENKLSQVEMDNILQKYPNVAYGIILQDNQISDTLTEENIWLPNITPIFSYDDLHKIFSLEYSEIDQSYSSKFLSHYSTEYFKDKEKYTQNLQINMDKLHTQRNLLNESLQILDRDYLFIKSFDYDENWLSSQEKKIGNIMAEINSNNENISLLNQEKININDKLNKSKNDFNLINKQCSEKENLISDTIKLIERINIEAEKNNEKENLIVEIDRYKKKLDILSSKVEDLQFEYDELKEENSIKKDLYQNMQEIYSKVENCETGDIEKGDWQDLFNQYNQLFTMKNSNIEEYTAQFNELYKEFQESSRELERKKVEEALYKNVVYSEKSEDYAQQQKADYTETIKNIRVDRDNAISMKSKTETEFVRVKKELMQYNEEPLAKNLIGENFDSRIKQKKEFKISIEKQKAQLLEHTRQLQIYIGRIRDKISNIDNIESSNVVIELHSNLEEQWSQIKSKIDKNNKIYQFSEKNLINKINGYIQKQTGNQKMILPQFEQMINVKDIDFGRYYTLIEQIENSINITNRKISQTEIDLKRINESRDDLINQCVLQASRIYKDLLKMANSSKVDIFARKNKQQILKIDIPSEIDENIARQNISNEINFSIQEIMNEMQQKDLLMQNESNDMKLQNYASRAVSSSRLLRKYIGKDNITIQMYKIEKNSSNSTYRSWESTQVNNSGAEKIVVYFTLILSIMNYNRSDYGDYKNSELRSVLILDNPFGAISSPHMLNPMFEIAKHFKVQLICFSDIDKTAIMSCFDNHIQLITKQRKLSSIEMVTHDKNELIEHGYYKLIKKGGVQNG